MRRKDREITDINEILQFRYYYSSVIGDGVASFIEDSAGKQYALQKMFAQQAGKVIEFTEEQADSVCVFQIVSKTYTGKRKEKR